MEIWVTRHGQTDLNRQHLMQGRTDAPLNDTGIGQARDARARIGDIRFDAVYASPLQRAVDTAVIIGGTDREEIITDERLLEADFGPYEKKKYYLLGPAMTLYWALPEVFPAPKGVEKAGQLAARSASFLKELEQKDLKRVLIVCHGGIMRALSGYLDGRSSGLMWRPKPHNCEIRIFETDGSTRRMVRRAE